MSKEGNFIQTEASNREYVSLIISFPTSIAGFAYLISYLVRTTRNLLEIRQDIRGSLMSASKKLSSRFIFPCAGRDVLRSGEEETPPRPTKYDMFNLSLAKFELIMLLSRISLSRNERIYVLAS